METERRARSNSVLGLGLPMAAAMGGHAFFNIVDLAMVGAFEADPLRAESTLAGVTIASLLVTAPLVFMNGVSSGTVPVIARAFGAGNFRRANQFGRQALLLCIALSVLLGVVPAVFAEKISLAFDAQPGVELDVAADYLRISSYGAVTGFVLMQVTSNMRAIGMGLVPMTLMMLSNVGNLVGNWFLIYGKMGFPEMGAAGAAWATVGARAVASILGILFLLRAHPAIRLSLGGWRPRLRFFAQVVGSGLPVALQWTVRLLSVLVILFVVSGFGSHVKAAYGIGTRLETLAMFAGLGWGAACTPLVGHALVRRQLDVAHRICRQTVALCLITMSIAGVCYYAFPTQLIRLFSLSVDAELAGTLKEGTRYLRISVLAYPAMAVGIVYSHALNGAGSVRTPLLIDALGVLGLQLPLAWFLTHSGWSHRVLGLGPAGAWWSLVISHTLIALVYYLVFRRGAWERKRRR